MNRSAGVCPVPHSFALLVCSFIATVFFLVLLTGCGNSSLVSSGPNSTPTTGGTTPTSAGTTPPPGGTTGSTPPSNTGGSGEFAYVALTTTPGVAGVQVSGSGTAGPVSGSPFAAPGGTLFITRHGQFVFAVVGDFISATSKILTYTEDPSSGKLTLSSTLQYAHPVGSVATDPSGNHLYGLLPSFGIAAFSIGSGGQLSELAGSPYSEYSGINGPLVVAQDDKFLYTLGDVGQHNVNVPVIYTFPINTATGQLLPVSSFNFVRADVVQGLAITPDSRYALANNSHNQLCAYTLDPNSGAPTPVGSDLNAIPTACIATGSGPIAVAVHPGGRWVAVANMLSNNVSMYSFAAGAFTIVGGSPFSSGTQPQAVAFSSDGRYLFTSNYGSGDSSVFSVNASTGALTPLSGSPVQVGSKPGPVAAP